MCQSYTAHIHIHTYITTKSPNKKKKLRAAHRSRRPRSADTTREPQVGERLKGVVVSELDGTSGKKAWVSLGVMRRARGGKFAQVDGMIRLNREKGLKPKKVAVDRPLTVYVSKASKRC